LVGLPWGSFREAWFSEYAKQLIVIAYERLTQDPKGAMKRLYEELEQDWFEHDFDHVIYDEPDYDTLLGMPGLHKVQEKVEYKERKSCIPPDLFSKYDHLSFWTKPKMNTHGVRIL
jgi:sulfotransferase